LRAILFLVIFPFLFLFACGKVHEKKEEEKKPIVLVSIPPYAYFVERIAGETVAVETLVPPGSNLHLFEPTPKQVEMLSKSKLWISLGEPSEKKVLLVAQEQNPTLTILDLTQNIPLLAMSEDTCSSHHHDHSHEGKDRHIWLSLRLAQGQATCITEQLIALKPEHRQFYQQNLTLFLQDLHSLDQKILAQLEPFAGQAILVSHPAFGYFCKDYGLIQLSIECEGKDPRPQDLAHTLEQAGQKKVRLILTQAQYNNKPAILVAEKLHLPIYLVDPYSKDYLRSIEQLAQLISNE